MTKTRTSTLWRGGVLIFLLVTAVTVALTVQLPSVDEIHEWTGEAGIFGIALFVSGYALLTLTPVPKGILSIAGGVAWGLWIGALIVLIGALLGAALSFWLGRILGRDAIEQYTGGRVHALDEMLQRRGLVSVIVLRLIPILPFTLINYAAGLTAVRVRDYALGTVIGIIPGTVAYVAVGAYGAQFDDGFFIAVGALVVLTIGGIVAAYRMRTGKPTPERETAGAPTATQVTPENI
ncbi:TVP38/TMEM64 family protein [Rhodoglobus sp.]